MYLSRLNIELLHHYLKQVLKRIIITLDKWRDRNGNERIDTFYYKKEGEGDDDVKYREGIEEKVIRNREQDKE